MAEAKQIPIYLFTGFLESGKTKFIQETMEDKRFNAGERTLLLVCEEGIEEYSPEQFASHNVKLKAIEDESELTPENLSAWAKDAKAERLVVEYNGMWMLDSLYGALPEGWGVAQEFMFADAGSILSYNANMRQLCFDKLKSAELIVFNRYLPDSMDMMEYHKLVRGASRGADIAYETLDGKVRYDDIEDPLPFDIDAPIVEINDRDYALWYRDMSAEPKRYSGKTVRFKGRALKRRNIGSGSFVIGRHIMTCCVDDIEFAALICVSPDSDKIENDSWVTLTARLDYKFHRSYGRKGPVLTAIEIAAAEAPEDVVATFN